MNLARSRLSSLAVIAALVVMASAPAFAATVRLMCASQEHDCGSVPTIKSCCCGHEQSTDARSTPPQPRGQVRADFMSISAAVGLAFGVPAPAAQVAASISPPDCHRVDLPTLLHTLLI